MFLARARKKQKSAARKHFLIKWGIRIGKKALLRITIQLSYRKNLATDNNLATITVFWEDKLLVRGLFAAFVSWRVPSFMFYAGDMQLQATIESWFPMRF